MLAALPSCEVAADMWQANVQFSELCHGFTLHTMSISAVLLVVSFLLTHHAYTCFCADVRPYTRGYLLLEIGSKGSVVLQVGLQKADGSWRSRGDSADNSA